MPRSFQLHHVYLVLCLSILLASAGRGTSNERSALMFLPIDGSDKHYRAEDFGYKIKTIKSAGNVHVYINLDEEAARIFAGATITLTKGKKFVAKADTALILEKGTARKSGYLHFSFDPEIIDGGTMLIDLDHTARLLPNVVGFRLSIETLLTHVK